MKTLKNILWNRVDATGLAVFRMCFISIMIYEVSQFYEFRHIIYDKTPFIQTGEFNIRYLFHFWFIALGLLLIGLFTRTASIINYIFCVIIFGCLVQFNYAVFGIYTAMSFLILFMPVSNVLSFDSLIEKKNTKVLAANYLVPVFVGIGFIYFDSAMHKLVSPMWLKGLGVWLPASIPMISYRDMSWLLNQEFIMKFISHIVLIFETVFIFLFWIKPLRIPFLILGIIFHVGILITFPIPSFALGMIAVYVLMVPIRWWSMFNVKNVELPDGILFGFDQLKVSKYFWRVTIIFTSFLCILLSYSAPLPQKFLSKNDIKSINTIERESKRYLGIQQYKIFTDWAYKDYNHVFKIEYISTDTLLVPIFNNNGQPIGINRGVIWNNIYSVTKRANSLDGLEPYIPYCKYWLYENQIPDNGMIVFYRSDFLMPNDWSKNFLRKALERSWEKVAVYDLTEKAWDSENTILMN